MGPSVKMIEGNGAGPGIFVPDMLKQGLFQKLQQKLVLVDLLQLPHLGA